MAKRLRSAFICLRGTRSTLIRGLSQYATFQL